MNWIKFKDQLPELEGTILIRQCVCYDERAKEKKYFYYYNILTAEPMDIYSKMVWCKKIEGNTSTARVADLMTNEYMSGDLVDYSWIRLPYTD